MKQDIIKGLVFGTQHVFTNVGNNEKRGYLLKAIDKDLLITFKTSIEGKCLLKSFFNNTYINEGEQNTIFNRLVDGDLRESCCQVYVNSVVDVYGVQRFNEMLPASSGFFSTGGTTVDGGLATLIKKGQELYVEIENVSGNIIDIGVVADWIEM